MWWPEGYLQCILGEINRVNFAPKRQSSAWSRKCQHINKQQQTNFCGILEKCRNVCRKLYSVCVCVCGLSPIIVTSYSIWNRASWPHWANTLRASLWLALCSGTPSTLRRRSPGRSVPSLNTNTHTDTKKYQKKTSDLKISDYRRAFKHRKIHLSRNNSTVCLEKSCNFVFLVTSFHVSLNNSFTSFLFNHSFSPLLVKIGFFYGTVNEYCCKNG